MTFGGRCYSARAGRLEEALAYARPGAVRPATRWMNRGCGHCAAMEAEPSPVPGDWNAVVGVAEEALPAAWEIREWNVGCLCIGLVGYRLSEAGKIRRRQTGSRSGI